MQDGSKLTLHIYPIFDNSIGAKKGTVEKVLRVEFMGYQKSARASSPRKSWDISEEEYWQMFNSAENFRQVNQVILRINGVYKVRNYNSRL